MGMMITKMLEMDKEKMNETYYCRQKLPKMLKVGPDSYLV
jgi:hypothetical protein